MSSGDQQGPTGVGEGAAAPVVRRRVAVTTDLPGTWTALTTSVGRWWPLSVLSVSRDPAAVVAFAGTDRDGLRLVETADGREHVWGHVTRWEPPHGLVLAWYPGVDPADATELEIRLTPLAADSTLVEVVHRGWERWADGAAAAAEYDTGWPAVLVALATAVDEDRPPPVWHLLTHRPGPAATPGTTPWEQPWFAGHAGFLDRLKAAGALVAAGLLPAADGSTCTVVRGLDTAETIRRATQDDPAVTEGHLVVSVQPWLVIARGPLL